jgi:hypothetical protein
MNLLANTAADAPMFLFEVERKEALHPALMTAWQDFYCYQMDRAMGIENESLAMAIRLQSSMIDQFSQMPCPPALRSLFETATKALKSCLELQMSWLAMMVPISPVQQVSSSLFVLESAAGGHTSDDEYERCMDIALGSQAA